MDISRTSLIMVLLERGPRHGWGIGDDLRELTGEDIDRSTVYRGLQKMEEAGLVISDWTGSEDGPPRKTYRLTRKGRRRLITARSELETALDRLSSLLGREAM